MFQASSQGSVLSNQRFFSHILAVVIKNILKFKPSKEKGGIRGGIQTRNQIFLGWIWIRKKPEYGSLSYPSSGVTGSLFINIFFYINI